jgi:hypothetical protein
VRTSRSPKAIRHRNAEPRRRVEVRVLILNTFDHPFNVLILSRNIAPTHQYTSFPSCISRYHYCFLICAQGLVAIHSVMRHLRRHPLLSNEHKGTSVTRIPMSIFGHHSEFLVPMFMYCPWAVPRPFLHPHRETGHSPDSA